MDETAIAVVNLTKVFGGDRRRPAFRAVDGVSFTVPRGEVFGCLGPNGAGKTTTIRILLGLMRPTGGTVRVLGLVLPEAAKNLHARIGYMSQQFTLYDELTTAENLRFYGRAYGLSGKQLRSRFARMIELARLAGLEHELAKDLPGGWRQRLALMCAIVHDPELVFLDEPTAGVDPLARRELWELIYDLADQGKTIFVTTHYMDEAELCQRLSFMANGKIAAIGTPEELKRTHVRGDIVEIACDQPEQAVAVLSRARAGRALQINSLSQCGSTVRLAVPDARAVQGIIREHLAAAGVQLSAVEAGAVTIEDVFISVTQAAGDEG